MPHWLQVLLVVTFVASVLQSLFTGYDGNTLRENPSYRPEGRGGILYTLRGGTPSYTHENKRGDVVAKTNASGTLTYQAQYEAFGKQTATTGSTLDRQKSNSKDTDPTGLVDEGMRYRDLETGMFINRDPAGFVDGPNLYTYVIQNPWTKFDPEGLTMADLYQFWVGMGNGFIGVGKGIAQAVTHPAATVAGVVSAAEHPVNTATAVVNATEKSWNSGPEGKGEVMANVIAALVPGGAEASATSKVSEVADVANAANKVSKVDEVATAVNEVDKAAGAADKPTVTAETTCGSPTTCFTAGTLVLESSGEVPIETIHVGDRVLSKDAQHQESTTEVDTSTWKDFKLRVENEDNSRDPLTVEALRSPAWIKNSGAKLGSRIWFEAEDVGVKGWATVKKIDSCPPIKPGKGRVVLTTFTHFNNDLFQLQVANLKQAIEVTGLHRIYSTTRHEWVRTRNLHVGEMLQTYSCVRAVTGIAHEQGAQRVFNFEVEADHQYFVSDAQILVHNDCGTPAPDALPLEGRAHGGEAHDTAIKEDANNLPEEAEDVRMNQAQVKGDLKIGNNKPDLQWTQENQRHYLEVVSENSDAHVDQILKNDPSGIVHVKDIRGGETRRTTYYNPDDLGK